MRTRQAKEPSQKIAVLIKERRLELGISREELGKRLGYGWPNFITMIENGKSLFPIDRWLQFADELDLPRHSFLQLVLSEHFPEMMGYVAFIPESEEGIDEYDKNQS